MEEDKNVLCVLLLKQAKRQRLFVAINFTSPWPNGLTLVIFIFFKIFQYFLFSKTVTGIRGRSQVDYHQGPGFDSKAELERTK